MSRFPKALTFDVVGTLIDFESGMINSLRKLCGVAIDREAFLTAYRGMRARGQTLPFPQDLKPIYQELAPHFGLPTDEAYSDAFVYAAKDWPAFEDSVEAMRRLGQHFKLVAMTNTQRWAFSGMEKTLGLPFHDSITVDDALCEKPDTAFFGFTRGRLSRDGFLQGDILHVAQSQYHDIGIARKLGYTVCWIERRKAVGGFGGTIAVENLTKPDYHFSTLKELADLADSGGLKMLYS
ncbi:2-haloalkanoic acid dehalogenase [Acetobacter senegalensis]|uniref:2-haloalkanoic acid dehalogenase n=1 Tax=Acetobacter senegalensis TaxID=446692 RepID=A0A149TTU6_9PROT|nr:HAD-IA family hydrolase [Acetobacter senegalensis]KXV56624.1 2-haloalkanoic acid dehalogenase [Acetobacter senegalensis]